MSRAHIALLAALLIGGCLAAGALAMPTPATAAFGPEVFEDGTCFTKTCTYASVEADPAEAFTQAAGHPPWGGTKFIMKHSGSTIEGASVRRIRVDIPPGLAADPQAPLPKCEPETFKTGPSACPSGSVVGSTEMEAVAEPLGLAKIVLPKLEGTVYNLTPSSGLPLDFGIAVEPTGELVSPIRIFLEGHVAWGSDYHEYFEINNVPKEATVNAVLPVNAPLKVLMSKLNFNGHAGGDFLTLPSVCSSTTTSHLELESWNGEIAKTETHTPVGVQGCDKVPFTPSTTVLPETSQSDAPDGATTVVQAPQKTHEGEINTSDIKAARVTLPEGLTLNPAAAQGLQACTESQIAIGQEHTPVTCPAASRIGTVTIETDLPPGSLTGPVFLGAPSGTPITGPPYTIYLDANATGVYPPTGVEGVSVRLRGSVVPNAQTGRLEATFTENPQLPFSELRLSTNGGPRAPLANPLACGAASTESAFTPYTGGPSALSSTPFTTTGCSSPLPFSLSQGTTETNPTAGAYTSFTFNLTRPDGQQYLSQLATTLPAGLLGAIPSVPLCGEPQAQAGACPASSQIGTATVQVGAGSEPYSLTGPVYLTGPYAGAPYGLSIPVPATAGPFDLGGGACHCVLTRVTLSVDPHTARVIASAALSTIVGGVPLRLRSLSVAVTRPSFLFNPTNCSALATESTLLSTLKAEHNLASPFQVGGCAALPFSPSFKVATSARTSKLNGAGLQVTLTQPPHQANIAAVYAQLPTQLPARLTTLQQACPEATFVHDPRTCPPGSLVGGATVRTPVLPDRLSGPAYLVSHGGAAFPDLDLILEGDGVQVLLSGATNIKRGVTSSTFHSVPDVPVSSFQLSLPIGRHSALAATGSLCAHSLLMPTTLLAQNGRQIQQNTRISVSGCPVAILSRRVLNHRLLLKLRTFSAGQLTVVGRDLRTLRRHIGRAAIFTLKVPLSRAGVAALGAGRHPRVRVRVAFTPSKRGEPRSSTSTTVTLR